MKTKPKKISKSGSSMVEVFITIFIIGMVLVLYIAAVNTIRLVKTVKDQGMALRIAGNKMEQLRASGYDNLPSSGSFSDSQLASLPNSSAAMSITDFNTSTKQVLVTVEWREPSHLSARNVSLTTLITKTGGL
ncbi:MAG: hypothetical protein A3J76_04685 [Candidatus Moranbacteria bacterium RBG_13_45_13]|nr:MAG: hypothetical protein A3J76_04685 [Candidatus Moranbacteria bacterium RBG_13_45_13]